MSRREHHLDALRAAAMVLLVPYHAATFLRNGGEANWAEPFTFYIHTWHMPLFFALSGYLAAGAVSRRGTFRSIRDRIIRLGVPLAVGLVTVIPLANIVIAWYVQKNPGPTPPGAEFTTANIFDLKPLVLWFLIYLLILSVAAVLIWAVLRNSGAGRGLHRLFRAVVGSPVAIPVLALATTAILVTGEEWEATRKFGNTFVPHIELLGYYGLLFGFGWMLSRNRDLLPKIERWPLVNLLLGVAAAAVAYDLYDERLINRDDEQLRVLALFLGGGMACWLTLFGVWGVFARWLREPRAAIRYVADAAFWIYLVHLPALLLIENALATTDLSAEIRYVLATAGALAFALIAYAIFVRRTFIGRFLRGGGGVPDVKAEGKPASKNAASAAA